MNRCFFRWPFAPGFDQSLHHPFNRLLRWVVLSGALLGGLCAAASAAARPIPDRALAASFVVTQAPAVLLNGQPARLAPGARIWDAQHMLVLSAALTGQRLTVRYVLDMHGLISEVWVSPAP
jgi:hypothetical protein